MSKLPINGLEIISTHSYEDNRGKFTRIFDASKFPPIQGAGLQVNISENPGRLTLRGMHYQIHERDEHKAITVLDGSAFIAVVDLRQESQTYEKVYCGEFNGGNYKTLFVPAGCATGWLTLQENTNFHYLMYSRFEKNLYNGFKYNDPNFSIPWPFEPVIISEQDLTWKSFSNY